MCCSVLRTLEAVEGELYLLEVLDVPEVMRCVLHTLYAGGCGVEDSHQFSGFRNFHCRSSLVAVRHQAQKNQELA